MKKILFVLLLLVLSLTLMGKEQIVKEDSDINICPNPMKESTNISFDIERACYVTLEILDSNNNVVVTLVSDFLQSGDYSFTWDRVGSDGNRVRSGNYIVQVKEHKRFVTKRKTLILK